MTALAGMGVASTALAFWIAGLGALLMGAAFIPRLRPMACPTHGSAPKVSVIFAYRNEKQNIAATARSLLGQNYPDLEIIAVNDRSDDGGERLLEPLARDKRLKRVNIRALPEGWLGKCHALWRGAGEATGEWLIFTDADVIFKPDAIAAAVAAAERYRLDHLSLMPRVVLDGWIQNLFYRTFATLFALRFAPWSARVRWLPGYAGVGAFNMVWRSAYAAVDGHRSIAMDVADDVMLGRRIKRARFASMMMDGRDMISVRWFVGLKGMVQSLHKNAFRGLGYSGMLAAAGCLGLTVMAAGPAVALIAGPDEARWFGALAYGVMIATQFLFGRGIAANVVYGLLAPPGLLLVTAIIGRSAFAALRSGSVVWRGTAYSLTALRRGIR